MNGIVLEGEEILNSELCNGHIYTCVVVITNDHIHGLKSIRVSIKYNVSIDDSIRTLRLIPGHCNAGRAGGNGIEIHDT